MYPAGELAVLRQLLFYVEVDKNIPELLIIIKYSSLASPLSRAMPLIPKHTL